MLATSGPGIAAIAKRVGYDCEEAFDGVWRTRECAVMTGSADTLSA